LTSSEDVGRPFTGKTVGIKGGFMKVKDIMCKTLFCCTPTDAIQKAAELMKANEVGSIPVVNNCNDKKLLGIITDRDICVKAVAAGKSNSTVKVSEVMTKGPVTCSPDESIEACEALMERMQVRRIPVVDAQGVCIGIVAQADIALRDTAEHTSQTGAAISQHRHQPQREMAAHT
jgi:CBS domain-containing protein